MCITRTLFLGFIIARGLCFFHSYRGESYKSWGISSAWMAGVEALRSLPSHLGRQRYREGHQQHPRNLKQQILMRRLIYSSNNVVRKKFLFPAIDLHCLRGIRTDQFIYFTCDNICVFGKPSRMMHTIMDNIKHNYLNYAIDPMWHHGEIISGNLFISMVEWYGV